MYRQDIKFPGILERIIKRKGRPTPKYSPTGWAFVLEMMWGVKYNKQTGFYRLNFHLPIGVNLYPLKSQQRIYLVQKTIHNSPFAAVSYFSIHMTYPQTLNDNTPFLLYSFWPERQDVDIAKAPLWQAGKSPQARKHVRALPVGCHHLIAPGHRTLYIERSEYHVQSWETKHIFDSDRTFAIYLV